MKPFFLACAGALTLLTLGMAVVATAPSAAAVTCSGKGATPNSPLCKAKGGVDKAGGSTKGNSVSLTTRIHNIINLLIIIIGLASVIVIVVGGIRYTTSNGDAAQMTSAKNTIMYAVVGLVVAIMAYAIVGLVISQLSPPPKKTPPKPCTSASCRLR